MILACALPREGTISTSGVCPVIFEFVKMTAREMSTPTEKGMGNTFHSYRISGQFEKFRPSIDFLSYARGRFKSVK